MRDENSDKSEMGFQGVYYSKINRFNLSHSLYINFFFCCCWFSLYYIFLIKFHFESWASFFKSKYNFNKYVSLGNIFYPNEIIKIESKFNADGNS